MDFKKFTTAGIARSTSTPSASSLSSPAKKSLSVSLIKPEFTKPSFPNDEHLPIRLVLCFDGTGDTVKGSFSAVSGETVGTKDSIGTIWDLTKGGPVVDKDGKKFFQVSVLGSVPVRAMGR